jgi:hypothetical protein
VDGTGEKHGADGEQELKVHSVHSHCQGTG